MKVAIASSGLEHIKRGMEGWSEDISRGLYEKGVDVTLFKGSGAKKSDYEVILPTLKRNGLTAKIIGKITAKGGWRIGLGSPPAVESFVFGVQLLRQLRKGYDIVHIKQGSLAAFLVRAKKLGYFKVPMVLSNGQIANEKFLSRFDYVQHLTPCRESISCDEITSSELPENRFVIPNFIDTNKFTPQDKESCRKKLGLSRDAFIVLSVGTVKKYHKRMDYFIEEMSRLKQYPDRPLHFVITGARDPETEEIIKLGKEKLGDKLTFFLDIPRDQMPEIYGAADVFVLCSVVEAFGTVLIEAMSCKIPVVCHNYASFKWIIQEGGILTDMEKKSNLAIALESYLLDEDQRLKLGEWGRTRVLSAFSQNVVISKMIEMYKKIISKTN